LKFKLKRALLADTINSLVSAIDPKGDVKPVYACALIEVNPPDAPSMSDTVRITLTDLAVTARFTIDIDELKYDPVVDAAHQRFAIPAARLRDVLRASKEEDATIQFEGKSTVTIKLGRRNNNVEVMLPDAFPVIKFATEFSASMPVRTLLTAIQATLYAAHADPQQILSSVLISISNDGPSTAVALNGSMLSYYEWQESASEEALTLLIPAKASKALAGFLDQLSGDEVVQAATGDRHLHFKAGYLEVTANKFAGSYPAWNQARLGPEKYELTIEAGLMELADLLKGICILGDKRTPAVKLSIEEGSVTFRAKDLIANSDEELPVTMTGFAAPLSIGLNAAFVQAFLDAAARLYKSKTGAVQLRVKEGKAILLSYGNMTATIMPCRI
jgi:DNA polymerase III sliding clamp (beta) subunit (PCNA family)